jgi:hypothetical protein
MNDYSQHEHRPARFWKLRYSIVLSSLGAIGLYLLLREHRAHVLEVLPFVLLLACPLMHVFMHRGHGGHHGDHVPKHDGMSGPPQ